MRSLITIDKEALKNNYLYLKNQYKKDIIAVTKSNAYGHGLILICKELSHLGVTSFAVATLEEALELRKEGYQNEIILLEKSYDFKILSFYRISISISSISYLENALKANLPLQIHLKIETGMNRLGLNIEEMNKVKELLNQPSKLKIVSIYTHIYSSSSFENQIILLKKVIDFLSLKNIDIHINTTYNKNIPPFITKIRVGLELYGISENNNLKQVMSLFAPIYRIKKVKKGEVVGYDNEGNAPDKGYILTIPLGYADGWNPLFQTIAYKNELMSQCGKICMDYMMIFTKNEYKENEMIEIISPTLKIINLAKLYNVSKYVISTSLSYRIKRIYK